MSQAAPLHVSVKPSARGNAVILGNPICRDIANPNSKLSRNQRLKTLGNVEFCESSNFHRTDKFADITRKEDVAGWLSNGQKAEKVAAIAESGRRPSGAAS